MKSYSKVLVSLGLGSCLLANTVEDSTLNLWQISYKAETSYDDGYTIEGSSKHFEGSFHYDDGTLFNISGSVDPKLLSSGLAVRDEHVVEIVFEEDSGTVPQLQFRSLEAVTCTENGGFMVCPVNGEFSIRNEWQAISMDIFISEYEGRQWVHAESSVMLSDYDFYKNSRDETLKVADLIEFKIDLLGN